MRIALIIDRMKPYGAERVCASLAGEFSKLGHEVQLYTFGEDTIGAATVGCSRVRIRRPRNKFLAGTTVVWKLRKLLLENQTDVAISFMSQANILTGIALLATHTPVIATFHNVMPGRRRGLRCLLKHLEVKIVDLSARRIVAVSDDVARSYQGKGLLRQGRIDVIHNPVDLERLTSESPGRQAQERQAREWKERNQGLFPLVVVGALKPAKGQDFALELLTELPSCRLILIGAGSWRDDLMKYANALGVSDRLDWLGMVEDPGPWFQMAWGVLIPSRFEGFGLVAAEAAAIADRVYVSECAGMREVARMIKVPTLELDRKVWLTTIIRDLGSEVDSGERLKRLRRIQSLFSPREVAERYLKLAGDCQ